jgi:hypothetical protein
VAVVAYVETDTTLQCRLEEETSSAVICVTLDNNLHIVLSNYEYGKKIDFTFFMGTV